MKKIFLKDIAKDLNVSKTTVSLVLNDKGDQNKISSETQERIIAYAKEQNYVPNQLARGLSRGKSDTIGLIIPNIADRFYALIAETIERKAKDVGYNVIFSSTYEDEDKERQLINSMLNRQVDGLIIASTQKNIKDLDILKKGGFPFILIDRHYPEMNSDYVVVDNQIGTKKATEHLLKKGRKKVGFVTLSPGLEVIKQRLMGYKIGLSNYDIDFDQNLVKHLSRESYQAEMEDAMRDLLSFPNTVDSIVFATHYLTAVGLRCLKKLGIMVPREVAIVSFDQFSAFDLVNPPITSVVQPVSAIGKTALDILLNKIEGNQSIRDYNNIILETELIVRKSCGTL